MLKLLLPVSWQFYFQLEKNNLCPLLYPPLFHKMARLLKNKLLYFFFIFSIVVCTSFNILNSLRDYFSSTRSIASLIEIPFILAISLLVFSASALKFIFLISSGMIKPIIINPL